MGLEENEALNEHGPLGKRIFSVLFLVLFVATLGLGIVAPLMPVFAESLGATGIWLGVIFSGFSISRVIFMPLIGRLSDSRGRKKFITAGLLLYAVLSLLYPMAGSVYSLVAVRLIHGFASAMVFPIAMAYVADVSRRGNEGETMGTFNIAMFLGMGAGPLLGGALKDAFGFPAAFYSMSALTAVAFLITLFFLPDVVSSGARHRRHVPFRKMVESRTMKGILVFRMVSAMGRGSIMAFLPIIAARYDV
ncbi:MFS transporter, partial [bacterium]